jgi:alpha-glucosidase (family GH31 glycosyl hydrolase)
MSKKKKMIIGGVIGAIVLIAIILIIVFSVGGSKPNPGPSPVNPAFEHFNPYSVEGDVANSESGVSGTIHGSFSDNSNSLLALAGFQELYGADPVKPMPEMLAVDINKIPLGTNNKEIKSIKFKFSMIDFNVAKLEMGAEDAFSLPEAVVADPAENTQMRMSMLGFNYNTSPFSFNFTDKSDPTNAYVSTQDATLVFAEKYTQMDFTLPSWDLYGFGERVHATNMSQGAWTMWNKNKVPTPDDGFGKGLQSFGTHPFILFKNDKAGDFGGMFFRNANNQAPIVRFNQTNNVTTDVSYITTGGKIEVFFFLHGSVDFIIGQYQKVFGKPSLPPFYALGWQQNSDVYTNHTKVEEIQKGYLDAKLPLESIWLSESTMDNGMPFTIDNKGFMLVSGPSILQWEIDTIEKVNQHLIAVVHPAVPMNTEFNIYNLLKEQKALIMSTHNSDKNDAQLTANTKLVEQANFPDFMNSEATSVWAAGIEGLFAQVKLGGLSIQYDGPYTMDCDGECPGKPVTPSPPQLACAVPEFPQMATKSDYILTWYKAYADQSKESTYEIPFSPGNSTGLFDSQTVSLNGTQMVAGKAEQLWNLRNTYGLQMAQATYKAMTGDYGFEYSDQRPFIASESTFSAASGQYSGHFLAQNTRDWDSLRYSVAGILNMNFFGVPLTGADVCGTTGKRNDVMCARWYQLATFYPLARNNYIMGKDGQNEPYEIIVTTSIDIVKDAMMDRLKIMRYMYTKLFEVSMNGGTLIKPMFALYPTDPDAYFDLEQDFMVGDAIKVSPLLADAKTYTSYFPGETGEAWVNIFNFADIQQIGDAKLNQRNTLTPGAHVNAYIRPGAIIAMQNNLEYTGSDGKTKMTAMSSKELIENLPVDLVINPDQQEHATGSLLIDEGSSKTMLDNREYDYYQFALSAGSLKREWATDDVGPTGTNGLPDSSTNMNRKLEKITIVNSKERTINFACYANEKQQFTDLDISTDSTLNTITLTNKPSSPMMTFFEVDNIYFGDSAVVPNLCKQALIQW